MTDPVGLYLHIPFCAGKCYYCHFYSRVAPACVRQAYTDRLCDEIRQWGGRLDRPIGTFYIGGGTPSVLSVAQLQQIFNAVQASFRLLPSTEITLEANPESLSKEVLSGYRALGINRLSIGVQSADDTLLAAIGRRHTAAQAVAAVQTARAVGFDNISLDLILGLPGETPELLQKNAALVDLLKPQHLSLYLFSLEENTVFDRYKDRYTFPDEDTLADDYLTFCRLLRCRGYRHYEVSNFCLGENLSKHNTGYWLDKEYLGIGPSAHSFLKGKRFHYPDRLQDFMTDRPAIEDGTGGDRTEWLMLRLRLDTGFSKSELAHRFRVRPTPAFEDRARLYRDNGLVNYDGQRLSLTESGMLLSNSLICAFTEESLYESL